MSTTQKPRTRRIIDAVDDLTAELRLANQIEALRLGAGDLDHDESKTTSAVTRRRIDRRNRLRAEIRAGLGIEESS